MVIFLRISSYHMTSPSIWNGSPRGQYHPAAGEHSWRAGSAGSPAPDGLILAVQLAMDSYGIYLVGGYVYIYIYIYGYIYIWIAMDIYIYMVNRKKKKKRWLMVIDGD